MELVPAVCWRTKCRYSLCSSTIIGSWSTEYVFTRTRTQDRIYGIVTFFPRNVLAETNKFDLCSVLVCLVSELKKPPSSGLENRAVFLGFNLCFCNIFTKTDNCTLGAILSCFISELHNCQYQHSNSVHFCRVLAFLKFLPAVKK
jgi:hypothetical protein